MATTLIDKVQENLGYPPLQKIDPNTQKMVVDSNTPNEDTFSQAAIPAVLISLCKYVLSDEGATKVLENNTFNNWVNLIFNKHSKEAVETIASYSKESNIDLVAKLNIIANEAVKIAIETVGSTATIDVLKEFFNNEKINILLYLPATLNIGLLLDNDTIDDKTNKMEGPMSNMMKSIGSIFDSPVEEIKE